MGIRQSIQGDIDRRPRSNSTIETGVEVHGGSTRRPISHYHPETSSTSNYDEDGEDISAAMASLDISNALSSSGASSPTVLNGRNGVSSGSAPTHSHHHHHHSRGHMQSGSSGTRFSFRPGTNSRAQTFLQALAASGGPSTSSGGHDIKCPICHKKVPSDDVEVHLVMCFTRPRIAYNDDILDSDKGECAICLDDMSAGENIARLPCLCIYHKACIDEWFKRKNCCPEHPGEEE
ncbi:ring finger domain-containing protein [Ditylenchus destructor]|uniref:E3 ubiquitin-protein ligase ZNRF1 n=1 Tax=Ditylenchus destructor TaxID=166010 RepID=A0AAD4NK26_9BILA|nr:ring finger domain-containing protein [Ditylenchus destructor]